jgi:signal peptidase I
VAAVAYVVFRFVCIPAPIRGKSMEPTYRDGGLTFCCRWTYLFGEPERGDIVAVRLAGTKVMYLKRIVATAGDRVAFRGGRLVLNGEEQEEPYVVYPCDWELDERQVKPGKVYVVGDNRSVPIDQHKFGQVDAGRIVGGLLW